MPIPFIMPKFDMDQEKATVVSWLKGEGEWVERDESVLVVETEKVSIEVPAPASGVLAAICAQPGEVVPVTQVIAYLLKEGETLADLPGAPKPGGAAATEPAAMSPAHIQATPVAARVARELGLDLAQVPAAGPRITRQDVEQYARQQTGAAANPQTRTTPATPAARQAARAEGIDLGIVPGSGPRGRVQARDVVAYAALQATLEPAQLTPQPLPFSEPTGRPAEIVPLAGMRRTIAGRMQASFHDAPHIALSIDVDVTELEKARTRLNAFSQAHAGAKITLTALLVRLVAWALERNPALNASLIDDQIYYWKDINIGVATAVENGLIVPVIHSAGQKPVHQLAEELQAVTQRAREGRLSLGDVQHGTFTISNLGMFGIEQFRAIINPPECGILAVGAVVRKPVVINEQDEVAVRPVMAVTLSADHRIVDGVLAARFLADLRQALGAPELALY